MSEHYDFHYQPTGSGAISGQQVLEQTEDAINELGDYVNDNVGGAMDVAQQALETAQTAETNAQTALDTANSFSDAIQSAQQDASTALSTAQTAQTTASNANNTAIQAQQDASSAVTTANNASGQVSTLSGTVTALGQRVTTAEGNIGQNTSDITALGQRVGTAEGNITTLQNDVTIAQGNASSAMATAGQVKQQAFVFRYSSTALVASSTNSNALLDNTDNLKVGDKVIDSSGVLFSITAIDTQNSTFTIGTALIDLAQDSDVMHLSGNERSSGDKTFEGQIISNSSILISNGSDFVTGTKDQKLTDKNNFSILNERITYNNLRNVRYTWTIYNKDANGNLISSGVQLAISPDGQAYFYPINDNDILFGASTAYIKGIYTKLINSINPGALSMPASSGSVDISAYITDLSGGINTYTPPVDGFVYVDLQNADNLTLSAMGGLTKRHVLANSTFKRIAEYVHVRANAQVAIVCHGTLKAAAFIPCQGNI